MINHLLFALFVGSQVALLVVLWAILRVGLKDKGPDRFNCGCPWQSHRKSCRHFKTQGPPDEYGIVK